MSLDVRLKKTRLILLEDYLVLLLCLGCPRLRWMFSDPDLLQRFWLYWAVKWYSEPPFIGCPPIRREILNVSQIAVAFHGMRRPILIQTWLRYCRCTFFHSAHRSPSNPICFWSVWCRRTKIPGKIFSGFAKFQGIVSVNDFRLPIRLQEVLQALVCFLRSFCSTWVGLYPLSSQAMIVAWFTSFTVNFVIRSFLITKLSALGTTVPVRLLQEALVIFVLKQISQFRSFGKWANMLCLLGTTFARGSKGNSWEELEASRCSRTLASTNPSLSSCSQSEAHLATQHPAIPRRHFYLGFWFLLIYATGLPVLMCPACCWNFRVSHSFLRWRCRRSKWFRWTRW